MTNPNDLGPVTVLFEPVPGDGVPFQHRVKQLLKAALRSYGLRAIEVKPVDPKPVTCDPPPEGPPLTRRF